MMEEDDNSTILIRNVSPDLNKKINEHILYTYPNFHGNKNKAYISMLEGFLDKNHDYRSIVESSIKDDLKNILTPKDDIVVLDFDHLYDKAAKIKLLSGFASIVGIIAVVLVI